MGTKRAVNPADKAKFFAAIASGKTIRDAARISGVHVNTGSNWLKKAKLLEANRREQEHKYATNRGGRQQRQDQDFSDAIDLPSAVAIDDLCEEARLGLDDFDFFRRRYLGRVQVPLASRSSSHLGELLESEEKEFVVLNVPPGAGKSTLFHDVAVWAICTQQAHPSNDRFRIGNMAKQYSRRIRETLERPMPLFCLTL
jgi:hypothetical protein